MHPAAECAAGYYWENTCMGEKAVCACKANKVCTGYVTAVCYAGTMDAGGACEAQGGPRGLRVLRGRQGCVRSCGAMVGLFVFTG